MSKTNKALVLFSGGLDSILAALSLRRQGLAVTAICFESSFFNAKKARESAEFYDLNLMTVDISVSELELVKNPPHGYGRNLNPCLDCHALMLRQALSIMVKDAYDVIATGEVLGQRPFSQTRSALDRISVAVGIDILRPLSAKLLKPTIYETSGLVKRHKLQAIEGRSRIKQFALAKKWGVDNYPSPAGGCLLTDSAYSERLGLLLDNWPGCSLADVELIKNGRMYWFKVEGENKDATALLMIGRDKDENANLEKLAQKDDFMVELKDINGPLGLLRGLKTVDFDEKMPVIVPAKLLGENFPDFDKKEKGSGIIAKTAVLTSYYATKARGREAEVVIKKI